MMDLAGSQHASQPSLNVEIKQEPVSPPSSDIEEEEYVTSDLYGSSCFSHVTIKKEEPLSSPEASAEGCSASDHEAEEADKSAPFIHRSFKRSASPSLVGQFDDVSSSCSRTETEPETSHGVPLQVCLEVNETAEPWAGSHQARSGDNTFVDKNNNGGGEGVASKSSPPAPPPAPATTSYKSGRRIPLQCPLCPYMTNNATTMREHLPVHTGERPHRCPTCGKRFSRKKYFRVHLRLHDKNGDNDASDDDKSSGNKQGDSVAPGSTTVHTCEECGETFTRSQFLRRHVQTVHVLGGADGSGVGSNTCPECKKSYKYAGNLRTHMRIHTGERPYMCDVCGLRFTCSSYLQVHLRTHVQEKPYACPHCSKTFVHNSALTVHLRTHTGEQPYQCPHCPLRFSHLRNMKRHEICIHTREYPHVCPLCQRGFLVVTHWRYHLRFHHGVEDPLEEGDDSTPRHGRRPGAQATTTTAKTTAAAVKPGDESLPGDTSSLATTPGT